MVVFFGLMIQGLLFSKDENLGPLIEKGEKLVEQGAYPSGIAILETVHKEDPGNARVLNLLLSACDAYSQKLIDAKHFEMAEEYLRKMDELLKKIDALPDKSFEHSELNSQSRIKREVASAKAFLIASERAPVNNIISLNSGREHYNEAVQYYNKRQYGIAERLLKESIELDPTNPYAYELLGEMANLNQDLEQAEAYYRKAFSLNPEPKMRAKFEKLMLEKKVDVTQQQYTDEHFIIRYRRSEAFEGSSIRDYLREAYQAISQDFGHYPKYKVPVVLYDRSEYNEIMSSAPHWSGALYDGKIRLPIYENKTRDIDLKKLIFHELTHSFVLDLSRMKCPVWLNEGLAQFQENKIVPIHLAPFEAAYRSHSMLSLDELMFEDMAQEASHEKAILFYLESFSLTKYIADHYGFYKLKEFLKKIGLGDPVTQAFETIYGRTLQEVSGEWQKDLEQNFKS